MAAPLMLKLLEDIDAGPGLGDCMNIVGVVALPLAPPAAPLTLKSPIVDAAVLILRRIAGPPSRIAPLKPS